MLPAGQSSVHRTFLGTLEDVMVHIQSAARSLFLVFRVPAQSSIQSLFSIMMFTSIFTALSSASIALVAAQSLINGTIERVSENFGTDDPGAPAYITPVGAARLTRDCLLRTRQKGAAQYVNGTYGDYTFGGYENKGKTTYSNFTDYSIPDGTLIDLILDVSASSDIDLHVYLNTSQSSSCVADYTWAFPTTFGVVSSQACPAPVGAVGFVGIKMTPCAHQEGAVISPNFHVAPINWKDFVAPFQRLK
ncbi:hypothetical protein DL96DRAFT_1564949 [Flagelloscypha sp. PMI_526]|nr:hypothetical protein DL96DRAFT_1564949 [Flagelloscypha sp. PMI_526]